MNLRTFSLYLFLFAAIGGSVQARLITFDDLTDTSLNGEGTPIKNGYAGLDWDNFNVLNTQSISPPNGFVNGTVSVPNVAYNVGGLEASISSLTPIDLDKLQMAANNYQNLVAIISAYYQGTLETQRQVTLSTTGATFVELNFHNVTSVVFDAGGREMLLDDVSISFVPEPSHYGFAVFLALAGLVVWRRLPTLSDVARQ